LTNAAVLALVLAALSHSNVHLRQQNYLEIKTKHIQQRPNGKMEPFLAFMGNRYGASYKKCQTKPNPLLPLLS